MRYALEAVFNEATFPEVTFVRPKEYPHIRSAFRSKGKHLTIIGPSGTGKTTLVKRTLRDLDIPKTSLLELNGREFADRDTFLEVIGQALGVEPSFQTTTPLLQSVTFVIVDDFHHLKPSARLELAKLMKLWHEYGVRFVVVGIASSAGDIFGADPELGIRNDPFDLKTQDDKFVSELIGLGEEALNVTFAPQLRKDIIAAANGVPSIVQVICKSCCVEAGIEQTVDGERKTIDLELRDLRESVLRVFRGKYFEKVVGLAKGKQQARSVHNTYFDIVATIAAERSSEIPIELLYRKIVGPLSDTKQRARKSTSFNNCLANLSDVISEKGMDDMILFKKGSKHISIEDPSFRFYMNLVAVDEIKSRIHIRSDDEHSWDVAVSFAGEIRELVKEFVRALEERGVSVFYDFDQQAQLWGKDLRQTLANVYANEARYMVVFLSEAYPEKDWTDFELAVGKAAAGKRTDEYLLPIVVDNVNVIGIHKSVGYIDIRKHGVNNAADLLAEKINQPASSR